MRRSLFIAVLACLLDEKRAPETVTAAPSATDAAIVETAAASMIALEEAGLSLAKILGARGPNNDALANTPAWTVLRTTVETDIHELETRPGISDLHPRKRFPRSWLNDPRAHFELIAAVNRLDRTLLEPSSCGEARLIYRLVMAPEGRPHSSLPMTVNVAFAQPPPCRAIASDWANLPPNGPSRISALAALFQKLPGYTKVEINLQTFHATAQLDLDAEGSGYGDHAEYLLRSFDHVGDTLRPRLLLDTPRFDLDDAEKRDLAAWITANFSAIDGGNWVIPDRFLATRALSVAPRGFARGPNRVFGTLFSDARAFSDLPYAKARMVRSPEALLRRLDQGTCEGCHMTRSVAGFHILGESRTREAHFDAVALPVSAHFDVETDWRSALTKAIARGERFDIPRPFADRKRPGPGRIGAHCGVGDDPSFAGWTCMRGLRCQSFGSEDMGRCWGAAEAGIVMGDACEDPKIGPELTAANGSLITPTPPMPCFLDKGANVGCDPSLYGFPNGMCIAECFTLGAVSDDGEMVCHQFPAAGYENECFLTSEPIETCIARHLNKRVLRTCEPRRPCRDDYACARMVGVPARTGVCVPTYSIYGLRVDGPILDR